MYFCFYTQRERKITWLHVCGNSNNINYVIHIVYVWFRFNKKKKKNQHKLKTECNVVYRLIKLKNDRRMNITSTSTYTHNICNCNKLMRCVLTWIITAIKMSAIYNVIHCKIYMMDTFHFTTHPLFRLKFSVKIYILGCIICFRNFGEKFMVFKIGLSHDTFSKILFLWK